MSRTGVLGWLALALAVTGILLVLVAGPAVATAPSTPSRPPGADPIAVAVQEPAQTPTPEPQETVEDPDQEPDPGPLSTSDPTEAPAVIPTETPAVDPTGVQEQDSEPGPVPSQSPSPEVELSGDGGTGIRPSVRRSVIPTGTIALAVGVLAVVGLGVFLVGRQDRTTGLPEGPAPTDAPALAPASDRDPAADREVIAFLLELGEALIDAGDAVNRVGATLVSVAKVQGLADVGVVVLPTALIISVPGRGNVQTDVTAAGAARLRLDQIEAVVRIVDLASRGDIQPSRGRAELARVRASTSTVPMPVALAGYALAAVGLALILRGGTLEVALAAGLGAAVAVLQFAKLPRQSDLRPFLPLAASFLVACVVFLVARVSPGVALLPPLVAPLIPFLPGALLTMGTLELATGQSVSGVARLASGGLQLVLLAAGIVGAAQFVGLPGGGDVAAATSATGWGGVVGVLAPWLGVALFGVGVAVAHSARRSSLPWILLVLVVAYAGQIVGGLFFGPTLSAFFGAMAMTPVAVFASRQPLGPPPLVTFLPAFWLLVPGALGLEGVTRVLGESGTQGLATLISTGSTMVAIALGILLGLLVVDPRRLGAGRRRPDRRS